MKQISKIFYKRNIERNARIKTVGFCSIHRGNTFLKNEHKYFDIVNLLKEKYILFKKIEIPQLEFVLTTKCNLNCKECVNYIPIIKNHKTLSFENFKKDLNKILKVVDKINSLILLGGEPLLIKDFEKYIEFASNREKISQIFVFSNGTIVPNVKIINIMKKYNNKVTFCLSNYSSNKELKGVLKNNEILHIFKKHNIKYDYDYELKWLPTTPPKINNRTRKENKEYFLKCLNACTSILDGKIFVCPRAGFFYNEKFRKKRNTKNEYIDVRSKNFSDKELIKWYSKDYYSLCDLCNTLDDWGKKHIIPAKQKK